MSCCLFISVIQCIQLKNKTKTNKTHTHKKKTKQTKTKNKNKNKNKQKQTKTLNVLGEGGQGATRGCNTGLVFVLEIDKYVSF